MSLKNFSHSIRLVDCKTTDSITYVAQLMKEKEAGTVLVINQNQPVGMVTDRDIALRCIHENKDPKKTPVEEIMSQPVQVITDDASILDMIEAMANAKVRRICLVDSNNTALGVVSISDVFELLTYELSRLSEISSHGRQKLFRRTGRTATAAQAC